MSPRIFFNILIGVPMIKSLQRSHTFRKKGFALVESIIALLILAIALIAMTLVPVMSTKLALQTVRREQAMGLASKNLNFLESVKSTESITSTDIQSGDFTVTLSKPAWAAASADDYKAIVTVEWSSLTGDSSLVLERHLSKFAELTRIKD